MIGGLDWWGVVVSSAAAAWLGFMVGRGYERRRCEDERAAEERAHEAPSLDADALARVDMRSDGR